MPQLDFITNLSLTLHWLVAIVVLYSLYIKYVDMVYLYFYETLFAVKVASPHFFALITSKILAYEWVMSQLIRQTFGKSSLMLTAKK